MADNDRAIRELRDDITALREDNRRLRADLDVLRSGRLGTLGFKSAVLAGDNAIASRYLQDGAVGTTKIADLAVDTAKIADLAVTDAKIASLAVDKLTAGEISVLLTLVRDGGRIDFADGVMRLDEYGLQTALANLLDPNAETRGIFFHNEAFQDDPGSLNEVGYLTAFQTGFVDQVSLGYNIDAANSRFGQVNLAKDSNQQTMVGFTISDNTGSSGLSGGVYLVSDNLNDVVYFEMGVPLQLHNATADPNNPLDGWIYYNTTTDKIRALVDNEWTDIGGGGGMKTSGGGYYTLPAMPSAGTSVTSSTSANTYGSWVEFRSASGNALYIVGMSIRGNEDINSYLSVDIGTGAAASETSVGEVPVLGNLEGPNEGIPRTIANIVLPFPIPVAASTRIAVRTADEDAAARSVSIVLHVIDQADLVSM